MREKAAAAAIEEMRGLTSDAVCLADLGGFGAISLFYEDFRQLEDADVTNVLDRLMEAPPRAEARE